jgi:hypothetical protein
MNEAQIAGMADELDKIKEAGWGSLLSGAKKFFGGGLRQVGNLASKTGRSGLWQQAKDLPGRLRTAYQHGGAGGVGKALLRSKPVQLAGVAAVPFAAGRMSKRREQ